jgi:hypothetical protein
LAEWILYPAQVRGSKQTAVRQNLTWIPAHVIILCQ